MRLPPFFVTFGFAVSFLFTIGFGQDEERLNLVDRWPRQGDAIYVSVKIIRRATGSDISTRRQAGIGIPYDRLSVKDTAGMLYQSPACSPMAVKKKWSDGRISVADGYFRFRFEGGWRDYVFASKSECLRGWLDLQQRTRTELGGGPISQFTSRGVITFSPLPTKAESKDEGKNTEEELADPLSLAQ